MKRILSVLVILCAATLTVPAMANATTAAKHAKTTAATSAMHQKTETSAKNGKMSATHQKKENVRHARETQRNKKESKKG